jgi:hypothetical protein
MPPALATRVEGLRVVVADIAVDGADEIAHAAEPTAADALARSFGEPAFDLIQPRGTRGREVEVVAGPSLIPIGACQRPWEGRKPDWRRIDSPGTVDCGFHALNARMGEDLASA